MDARGRPSFSELKVGIFVLVTCVILGMAIFTIGTRVGLFEETFYARTYLNNVSGLKRGDIVLLAGVEVGNVIEVHIDPGLQLPETQSNQQFIQQIEELTQISEQLQQQIAKTGEDLRRVEARYDQAVQQYGEGSRQVRTLKREVDNLQDLLNARQNRLEEVQEDIESARRNLQNIVVVMQIRSEYRDRIREDSNISLGSIGLLGDKYIEISLGRSPSAPPVVKDPVDEWLGLGTGTREVVVVTGTSQPGFRELITGADDVLANLEVLSNKLNSILSELSEGGGTVGKFITDVAFYDNLNQAVIQASQTVDQATELIHDVRQGEGTIARLVQEQEVYDKIDDATDRLQKVLARIEQGEGTLGKIVNDPSIYEKSERLVGNIERITGRMDEGQGTLGKLSTDDQLYKELRQSLDRFAAFIGDIEQGKGTLGRLAKDEQLYQNLNQASSEVLKLLYDFRQNPRKFLTIKLELF
ncbi:hypothetical protein MYX75_08515 [Acidobacteria bacterium AH-259-A15]|nr:hypothetical protein [Acidobacteria bacterium AH-259-A15]